MYWRLDGSGYRCTVKRRAANRAYQRRSEKARAAINDRNRRRIRIGEGYHSLAASVEQAQVINAHIRRRLDEFKQGQQARKEAQGVA